MRIALFSDIHANLPALRTALDEAERLGAERVVVAGDLVGDGPHPAEVVRCLREREIPAIRGNVDRAVLELGHKRKRLERRLGSKNPQKRNRAWTALQLGDPEREWLGALPTELLLYPGSTPTHVVHGSPLGDTDYVYPSLTPFALESKLQPLGMCPAVLVCGHSHVPFARVVGGTLVVNCGSVGRPADGDPRGSFGVVDFAEPGRLRFGIARFAYPVEELVADLETRQVPGAPPDEYRRGVKS